LTQPVAYTRNTADVSPLLAKGKEITKTRPKTFITDGAHNFHTAYEKELYTVKGLRTKHIKHIRLQGDMNNNKMERMNGEVRDREKTMRGLKKMDTPILKGYQLYHNYIREHEALDGKTPAEKCGIKIEGKNKWLTLIQNSSWVVLSSWIYFYKLLDKRTIEKCRKFINDGEWIAKNYSNLLSLYENRYIAVKGEKVLNNDTDHLKLIYRLQKIFGKNNISNIQTLFVYKYKNL